MNLLMPRSAAIGDDGPKAFERRVPRCLRFEIMQNKAQTFLDRLPLDGAIGEHFEIYIKKLVHNLVEPVAGHS